MSAQTPPNILLINVDDLGWTDFGFMGSRFYETPPTGNEDEWRRVMGYID